MGGWGRRDSGEGGGGEFDRQDEAQVGFFERIDIILKRTMFRPVETFAGDA